MAKRKVIVTVYKPICDQCQQPIATRGARANVVEHQAVAMLRAPHDAWESTPMVGPELVLDFCNLTCKEAWLAEHAAAEAPALAEQAPKRAYVNEEGGLTSIVG